MTIKDHTRVKYKNEIPLKNGDYFGECSIYYGCPRTATITSTNYCTFAQIPKAKMLSMCKCFQQSIKDETEKYQDRLKLFKLKVMRQVPWFSRQDEEVFNEEQVSIASLMNTI